MNENTFTVMYCLFVYYNCCSQDILNTIVTEYNCDTSKGSRATF